MSTPKSDPLRGTEDITHRISGCDLRIHINIGPVCNNNCIFCMEEDREMRQVVNSALTPDKVRHLLEANRGAQEVCFTSGEPTLVPELPRYARWAKQLGYDRISVMTNGRRLAHMPYLEHLVRAGMTFFYVSIHGHTARLHGGLVREPLAFQQTVDGLDNITRLKRHGVTLHTSTVVTKRNYTHFLEIYRFLRGHGVDQVVFNVMQANGRANTYFDQLFPTYTEIAREFRGFLDASGSAGEERPEAFLVDIPLCTTTALPDYNRGYVEKHVHFAVSGAEDTSPERLEVTRRVQERHEPEGEILRVTREDLDEVQRTKRPECAACAFDATCEGVWKNYVARYGWDELVPVPR